MRFRSARVPSPRISAPQNAPVVAFATWNPPQVATLLTEMSRPSRPLRVETGLTRRRLSISSFSLTAIPRCRCCRWRRACHCRSAPRHVRQRALRRGLCHCGASERLLLRLSRSNAAPIRLRAQHGAEVYTLDRDLNGWKDAVRKRARPPEHCILTRTSLRHGVVRSTSSRRRIAASLLGRIVASFRVLSLDSRRPNGTRHGLE